MLPTKNCDITYTAAAWLAYILETYPTRGGTFRIEETDQELHDEHARSKMLTIVSILIAHPVRNIRDLS